MGDLNAFMDSVNRWVTGTITMRLYKGRAVAVARSSPHALYDAALAGFGESGGLFSQQASPGLHRAVVAAEPHGPSGEEPGERGIRRRRCSTGPLDIVVWKLAMRYLRQRYGGFVKPGAAVATAAALIAVYVATRGDDDE